MPHDCKRFMDGIEIPSEKRDETGGVFNIWVIQIANDIMDL